MRDRRRIMAAVLAVGMLPWAAMAQQELRLDEAGQWRAPEQAPPMNETERMLADARAALADGKPSRARELVDDWIEANRTARSPYLAPALLIRGDALTAMGREYHALYDYEELALDHAGSPEFARAIEREVEIALRYLGGLRRKFLGLRVTPAQDVGEELLVRAQERLPGTPIAERAAIELADYYYRENDLIPAADAYEIYATNFPNGPNIDKARQRRIYANIARFKGPNYDTAGLVDARALIEDFEARDPLAARRAGLDADLVERLDEAMATQLWERSRWYLTRRDPVSARATLRRLVERFPRTEAGRRALEDLNQRGWSVQDPARVPPPPASSPAEPAEPKP